VGVTFYRVATNLLMESFRNRAKGIDGLFDFVKNATNIQDLAVAYSTTPDEAQTLAERMDPYSH